MEALSESQVLEALRAALAGPTEDDTALTAVEISDACGVSSEVVRKRLRPYIKGGKVEVVRKRQANIAGIVSAVIAYRFKEGMSTTVS